MSGDAYQVNQDFSQASKYTFKTAKKERSRTTSMSSFFPSLAHTSTLFDRPKPTEKSPRKTKSRLTLGCHGDSALKLKGRDLSNRKFRKNISKVSSVASIPEIDDQLLDSKLGE